MISIKNITKKFGKTLVLDNISLDVSEGEVIAIMGASGSGKSTLLKIISGLAESSSGGVSCLGKDTFTKSLVSQKPSLLPWRTVKKNIFYGLELKGLSYSEAVIENILKTTQLFEYADSLPGELSGGMQQRVALAAAIITQPDLLVMDEPLSALDTQTKSQMRDFIRALLVEKKQTTIIVTHDPEEAIFLADRIVILSPKPAKVIDQIIIPFAEERHRGLVYEESFLDIKKYISYIMYAESIQSKTDQLPEKKSHLTIGSNIWAGTFPLYYAREEGLYEKNGLNSYDLLTLEWSSSNRMMPLNEGLVDVLNMTLDTAIVECEKNPDLRILMPLDVSSGGDALISSSTIKSFPDLKGKRIAVEKSWLSEFYLRFLLKKNNINIGDITVVDLPSKDAPRALLSLDVDAIVAQEPWISEIYKSKAFNVLATTKNLDLIYAVVVVNEKTLREKKVAIDSFVQSVQKSIDSIITNSDYAVNKTAHALGISNAHLKEQSEKLRYIPLSEYGDVTRSISKIEETLLDSGMIKKPFDRSKLLF